MKILRDQMVDYKLRFNCPACRFIAQHEFDTCPKCGVIREKYIARQLERERIEAENEKARTTLAEQAKVAEDNKAIAEDLEKSNSKLHATIDQRTKIVIGVIIPYVLFIVFHIMLVASVGGKGDLGFSGMILFYCSFVYIPLLVLCNYLIMIPAWRHISIVKILGLVLPVIAAFAEYCFIYG